MFCSVPAPLPNCPLSSPLHPYPSPTLSPCCSSSLSHLLSSPLLLLLLLAVAFSSRLASPLLFISLLALLAFRRIHFPRPASPASHCSFLSLSGIIYAPLSLYCPSSPSFSLLLPFMRFLPLLLPVLVFDHCLASHRAPDVPTVRPFYPAVLELCDHML